MVELANIPLLILSPMLPNSSKMDACLLLFLAGDKMRTEQLRQLEEGSNHFHLGDR